MPAARHAQWHEVRQRVPERDRVAVQPEHVPAQRDDKGQPGQLGEEAAGPGPHVRAQLWPPAHVAARRQGLVVQARHQGQQGAVGRPQGRAEPRRVRGTPAQR